MKGQHDWTAYGANDAPTTFICAKCDEIWFGERPPKTGCPGRSYLKWELTACGVVAVVAFLVVFVSVFYTLRGLLNA